MIITKNVDGTLTAMVQHCILDLLIITEAKNTDQEKDTHILFTRDSVCVVMDTTKGELSFVLNGVNLGVAYKRIPLDKHFVSSIFFKYHGDSVEPTI